MALNVPLLRQSFELVVEREPELTRHFYEYLFTHYPQTQALFGRNTPATQQQMLTEALVAVVDHLEDAPWLASTLGQLGARHVEYGITDEMYGWVGQSLLATLATVAADAWTSDLADAWTEAYGAIVSLMQAGASASVAA
jgi:hemoglobin-like flavoprotein